jgi:hypothetical protein
MASLYRKNLPSYTTERYYLLSEIEEWSHIVTLNELSTSFHTKKTIDVFHFIWNQRTESLSNFIDRTEKSIVNVLPDIKKNALVTVQILTDETHRKALADDSFSYKPELRKQFERDIVNLLQYLENNMFYLAQVAVSDRTSSTTALEYGHDWVVSIAKHRRIGQREKKIGRLIVNERSDCMGLDSDREPDAEKDVFQVLYSSLSTEETQRLCWAMVDTTSMEQGGVMNPTTTTAAKSNYFLNWVILVAAVAVAAYLSGFTTKR